MKNTQLMEQTQALVQLGPGGSFATSWITDGTDIKEIHHIALLEIATADESDSFSNNSNRSVQKNRSSRRKRRIQELGKRLLNLTRQTKTNNRSSSRRMPSQPLLFSSISELPTVRAARHLTCQEENP